LSLFFLSFLVHFDFLGKPDRPLDTILHSGASYCHRNITVSFLTYKIMYQLTCTEKKTTDDGGVHRSLQNFASSE